MHNFILGPALTKLKRRLESKFDFDYCYYFGRKCISYKPEVFEKYTLALVHRREGGVTLSLSRSSRQSKPLPSLPSGRALKRERGGKSKKARI